MRKSTLHRRYQTQFHKAINEFEYQFTNVQNSLSHNIHQYNLKRQKIKSVSQKRIMAYKQMIDREKQLTEYANELVEKQRRLKENTIAFSLSIESQHRFIDNDIEYQISQMKYLEQFADELNKKRLELQISHGNLTQDIEKSTHAIDTIKNDEDIAASILSQSSLLLSLNDENDKIRKKIQKRKIKINQIQEFINTKKVSILQANNKLSNAKVTEKALDTKAQRFKQEIIHAKQFVKKNSQEIKQKQDELIDQISEYKKEETKYSVIKNTMESRNQVSKQVINEKDRLHEQITMSIEKQLNQISEKEIQLSNVNHDIGNMKLKKEGLSNTISKKDKENEKSKLKITGLYDDIQKINEETRQAQSMIIKVNEETRWQQQEIKLMIPLVNECINYYQRLEEAVGIENKLSELLIQAQKKKDDPLPNFEEYEEIKAERENIQLADDTVEKEIQSENNNQIDNENIIRKIQEKKEEYISEITAIQNKIKETQNIADPLLTKYNCPPTVDSVEKLTKNLESQRHQHIHKKTKEYEALEERYIEAQKRINLRKRKIKRQMKALETYDIDYRPDEEKLAMKTIYSLNKYIKKAMQYLQNTNEVSDKSLLNNYQQQIDKIYDDLDEFILRS